MNQAFYRGGAGRLAGPGILNAGHARARGPRYRAADVEPPRGSHMTQPLPQPDRMARSPGLALVRRPPPRPGQGSAPRLAAPALAGLLACGAGSAAATAPLANAGFEADVIPPGAFVALQPQAWLPHDPNGLLATQPGLNALGVIRPLPGLEYFPGGTTEGHNAALVFLAGAGPGEAGLQQTLASTLQPGLRYTLQVDVGNIASGTSLPGSSGGAGVYFNLAGFPGYRIDLLAGGQVLASDANSLGGLIPEGDFRTAALSFESGLAPASLLGQALGIRLVNLKLPGTPAMPNIEVDFDKVRLDASPVPEPRRALLGLAGLAGLLALRAGHRLGAPGR